MRLPDRVAALVRQVGLHRNDAPPVFLTRGTTLAGKPLTAATTVYAASLSKQITATCAALLVHQGRLDTESTLARWLPELPRGRPRYACAI